jgi:beta-glucuronidase
MTGSEARAESPAITVGGLLRPQRNPHRDVIELGELWEFQPDLAGEGEAGSWFNALPASRLIPVPCSWNELFDDLRDYLGLAWYLTRTWIPAAWQGQRIILRVGSANYAAKVWVNGEVVATHEGGHLPFVADITDHVAWDRETTIAITVENEQLPEQVPPGPGAGKGGIGALMRSHPATTYDFFPYAGLHRPVTLHTVPADAYIDDIIVTTGVEGTSGTVDVTVITGNGWSGKGRALLGEIAVDLAFSNGRASARIEVPNARLWSPADPHLISLTVSLSNGDREIDRYSLQIGIRTIAVEGDRLLLNGEPIHLTGFGKHEDFALTGRAHNLPMWTQCA